MEYFMKKLQLKNSTCVLISVATAIYFIIILMITNPAERIIQQSYPTEDEYLQLEEYSLEVAKTLNPKTIEDEAVEAELEITDKYVIVEIKSLKRSYSVISEFPVLVEKNDEFFNLTIDYENVEHHKIYNYQEFSEIFIKRSIIGSYFINFMWGALLGLIVYWILSQSKKTEKN